MTIRSAKKVSRQTTSNRGQVVMICLYLAFLVIICRLFYWQIIKGNALQAEGESQYTRLIKDQISRGKIYTADNYLLVGNQIVYRLTADPSVINQDIPTLSKTITQLIIDEVEDFQNASESAVKKEINQQVEDDIKNKLSQKDKKWVSLKNKISQNVKQKIADLNIYGLGFEAYEMRYYPEASAAAHLTGFVGRDENGEEIGYFGLEGALDKELRGVRMPKEKLKDALGLDLIFSRPQNESHSGRDIITTIHRDIQLMVEKELKQALEQYQAISGEVIVMDPKNGDILALAAFPNYDQANFFKYDPAFYKNPSLSNTYEPGSTFKTLTVSAGIDKGVIKPDTTCPICAGPRTIGKYTIRTWNDQYNPDITMTDALAKSDNTAMIFVAESLGKDTFIDYLHKFKIGEKINIELQEDTSTPMREKWGDIDLATNSFGQGIVVNSLQLVRAVSTIANQGEMIRPRIVKEVIDPSLGQAITVKSISEGQIISPKTAQEVTKMMIESAKHGEAQWIYSKDHTIAGKTGTSQVVIDGKYDSDKTIASFIGFAPVDNPKFIMLVKLNEPTTSIWAAETAAPLWYKIANKLFLFLDIPPDVN